MAAPKLNAEQKTTLLAWMAAGYNYGLIMTWFVRKGWPQVSYTTLTHYRKKYLADIDKLRDERHDSAMKSGLAVREERVARLNEHADKLDAIKWEEDPKTGRLHNEKAWRETLDQIAEEVGDKKKAIDDLDFERVLVVWDVPIPKPQQEKK